MGSTNGRSKRGKEGAKVRETEGYGRLWRGGGNSAMGLKPVVATGSVRVGNRYTK